MNPVKASPTRDAAELLARFRAAAPAQGFHVESFGSVELYPLLALTKRTTGPRPRIYISAGSHGDEPAGPEALLNLLEHGFFDTRAVWSLCPVINPVGLSRGTRENGESIDLNRDYRTPPKSPEVIAHIAWLRAQPLFDLTLCLHEDWESNGFYLYELNPLELPTLAEPMVKAVSQVCPIELAELIDTRAAKDGIIRPVDDPQARELWPEAIYLRAHHTDLCYTTESPSSRKLEQRVAAQCLAIETAVQLTVQRFGRSPR